MTFMRVYNLFLLAGAFTAFALCLAAPNVFAQGQVSEASDAARAIPSTQKKREYLNPSLANLAKTYWRLNKFSIDDKVAVDNFMKITECDLYSEFIQNEFEWRSIHEASVVFLAENKNKFTTRYQFLQPLPLGDYDFEREGFLIAESGQINGIRLFQMPSESYKKPVCGKKTPIRGYPRLTVIELSRPLDFDFLPFEPEAAKIFMKERMRPFHALSETERQFFDVSTLRNVVIGMNVRLFAYKGPDVLASSGAYQAQFLANLEEIYVYEDAKKQNVLFYKNFRVRQ